jgi:hypothetical protein
MSNDPALHAWMAGHLRAVWRSPMAVTMILVMLLGMAVAMFLFMT